jgi:hypothetical protein
VKDFKKSKMTNALKANKPFQAQPVHPDIKKPLNRGFLMHGPRVRLLNHRTFFA